jgi:hypothetical protein
MLFDSGRFRTESGVLPKLNGAALNAPIKRRATSDGPDTFPGAACFGSGP